MDYLSKSENDTFKIANKLLKKFPSFHIFGLFGDLGSGKTTFVKGIAKALGIKRIITSPTFVMMKNYPASQYNLVHIDAYRLENREDLSDIGFDDLAADEKNLIFIEWPERVFNQFLSEMKIIKFEYVDEKRRKISF